MPTHRPYRLTQIDDALHDRLVRVLHVKCAANHMPDVPNRHLICIPTILAPVLALFVGNKRMFMHARRHLVKQELPASKRGANKADSNRSDMSVT